MSVVTVTPNPSLDRTMRIAGLERGEVIRAGTALVDPGGKGINVARALIANGVPAAAVLPVGGAEGVQLAELLRSRGIEPVVVRIDGSVRANIALVEPDGTTTKINEPGPTLSPQEVGDLLATTRRTTAARRADWVVSSGSVPLGAPAEFHAQVAHEAHLVGARVAVDTSGLPLRLALEAGTDVVKPNVEELADLLGTPILTLGDVVDAAVEVQRLGSPNVLVSLGPDGVVLRTTTSLLHAEAPAEQPVSTSGAGDATLAGYLAAVLRGGDERAAAASAVCYGAAAVQLPGSAQPTPLDLRPAAVQVTDGLDRARALLAGAAGAQAAEESPHHVGPDRTETTVI